MDRIVEIAIALEGIDKALGDIAGVLHSIQDILEGMEAVLPQNEEGPQVGRCRDCLFFVKNSKSTGFCHRYAPRPLPGTEEWFWPMTFADESCGEWRKKRWEDVHGQ